MSDGIEGPDVGASRGSAAARSPSRDQPRNARVARVNNTEQMVAVLGATGQMNRAIKVSGSDVGESAGRQVGRTLELRTMWLMHGGSQNGSTFGTNSFGISAMTVTPGVTDGCSHDSDILR